MTCGIWYLALGADLMAGSLGIDGCAADLYSGPELLEVRTTAYWHGESDHRKYGRKSASGDLLTDGDIRSAAADWSKYPLGTRFRIDGDAAEYVVDDYGRALVGKDTIDLYQASHSAMVEWGVRDVEIEIIEWGSYEKSLEVLRPRRRAAAHVRAMIRSIEAKVQDA